MTFYRENELLESSTWTEKRHESESVCKPSRLSVHHVVFCRFSGKALSTIVIYHFFRGCSNKCTISEHHLYVLFVTSQL